MQEGRGRRANRTVHPGSADEGTSPATDSQTWTLPDTLYHNKPLYLKDGVVSLMKKAPAIRKVVREVPLLNLDNCTRLERLNQLPIMSEGLRPFRQSASVVEWDLRSIHRILGYQWPCVSICDGGGGVRSDRGWGRALHCPVLVDHYWGLDFRLFDLHHFGTAAFMLPGLLSGVKLASASQALPFPGRALGSFSCFTFPLPFGSMAVFPYKTLLLLLGIVGLSATLLKSKEGQVTFLVEKLQNKYKQHLFHPDDRARYECNSTLYQV